MVPSQAMVAVQVQPLAMLRPQAAATGYVAQAATDVQPLAG
jgi:hypothetical protein